jgi:hypothetical protein
VRWATLLFWVGLGNSPEQEPQQPPEEEEERLRGAALQARLPGLRTRAEPRSLQGSFGFGVRFLYLPLSLQGTLDAYPVPWLRLGAIYGAGLSFKSENEKTLLAFAQYGEAAIGLRLWHTLTEVDAELQLQRSVGGYGEALPSWLRPSKGDFADVVPVWLPSSHHLFVEGGALTGFIGLKRCTANCDPLSRVAPPEYVDFTRQLLVPFAGLRYVYYSEALSDKPSIHRVRYGQLFAHLLFDGFNRPDFDASYLNGDRVDRNAFGVRIGGQLPVNPLCIAALLGGSCAHVTATLGYTPYPAFLIFETHVQFPIR